MLIQSRTTPNSGVVMCLGDSQTFAFYNTLSPVQYYPYLLGVYAKQQGYSLDCVNIGNSGWSTSNSAIATFGLLSIAAERIEEISPDIFVYFAGVNDAGAIVPIAGSQTQSNIQAMLDLAFSGGVSSALVLNTNYLNYSNGSGDVTKTCTGIVRSGTTATATVPSHGWSTGFHVNIPNASDSNLCGNYSIAVVDANTFTFTVASTGAASTGACNVTKTYSVNDGYSGLRFYQSAAVSAWKAANPSLASKVSLCDVFAYQQSLIISGEWAQGDDATTQISANNQHMSEVAEKTVAVKIFTDLVANSFIQNYKIVRQ